MSFADPVAIFIPFTYKEIVLEVPEKTTVATSHFPSCICDELLISDSFLQPALEIPVAATFPEPCSGVTKKYLFPFSASSVGVPNPKIQRFAPSFSQFTRVETVTSCFPSNRSASSLLLGISIYPLLDVELPPLNETYPTSSL